MYQDQINLLVAGALAYPPCCPDVIICKLYMSVKLDEAQGKLSSIVPKGQLSGSGPTCWWISHPWSCFSVIINPSTANIGNLLSYISSSSFTDQQDHDKYIEQGGLRWVLVGSYIKSIATTGWGSSLTIQSFLAAINYWRSPSGRMCKVMGSKITLPLCPEFQWVGDEFMTSSFTTPSDKVSRGSQANRIYLHASGGLTSKWRRERILTWLQGVSKKSC